MEPIQGLTYTIEELLHVHEQMITLEDTKKEIIVGNRMDELLPLLQQQSKLVKTTARLEEERQVYISHFLEQKGFKGTDLTLSDILKLITNPQLKEELKLLSEKLKERLDQLRNQNQLNQQLIEQSLYYLDFSLRLMTEESGSYATYHRRDDGRQATPAQQRHFFDSKA